MRFFNSFYITDLLRKCYSLLYSDIYIYQTIFWFNLR